MYFIKTGSVFCSKKIHIACDHAGVELKRRLIAFLVNQGYRVTDHGTDTGESVDFPLFAQKVVPHVLQDERAILVCGTGQGMAMAANRHRGIRAALCWNEEVARLARAHNDSNVLCLGARAVEPALIESIVNVWLTTPFSGEEHHRRRIKQLDELN